MRTCSVWRLVGETQRVWSFILTPWADAFGQRVDHAIDSALVDNGLVEI